jgi:type II secretory pathway pseudopilin PulG
VTPDRRDGGRSEPVGADTGIVLGELAAALAIVILLAGMSLPTVVHAVDAGRARHAAGVMASRFRSARQAAILGGRSVGVLFDRAADGTWQYQVCEDGNGNGVRRTETRTGVDPCPEAPSVFEMALPGTRLAVDATLPGPDGSAASTDPVRFGASDLASFSPAGTCTAGTLFIRSAGGAQYAVRVSGVTGRTRILRYEAGSRRWTVG